MESVRLVTNGDWAMNEEAQNVAEFLEIHPAFKVAISCDRWHTNKGVARAAEVLKDENVEYVIATADESSEETIVPVGRAAQKYTSTFYSLLAQYCYKPDRRYTFLIDEDGDIYKCVYGLWKYDDVFKYLNGGFRERFRKFSKLFYAQWISNCEMCRRTHEQAILQECTRSSMD